MRSFKPDTIIALGGGSPMDAAKVMWLLYEHPEVNFSDLKEKFFDIRKRAFRFPALGGLAQLVCMPTTSGTGAEVTPFAVITDPDSGMKYPLADYALTPSVAIIDPILTGRMPAALAADSGFDALTHATEAFVSVYANDFTDGMALQAIRLIFDNIVTSVTGVPGETNTVLAREKIQCRHHRRNGIRQRLSRHCACDGAHHRGEIQPGARPYQCDAAAGRHPLQRHRADQADQLAEVRVLCRTRAFPADRRHARAAGEHTRRGRWSPMPLRSRTLRGQVGIPASFAAQGVDEHDYIGRTGRTGDGRLPRPVRAGEPADADAGLHEGSDGRILLRHLHRTGARAPGCPGRARTSTGLAVHVLCQQTLLTQDFWPVRERRRASTVDDSRGRTSAVEQGVTMTTAASSQRKTVLEGSDRTLTGWHGFAAGPWQDSIDVRDFIQRNYTPYLGDASFLPGATHGPPGSGPS